MFLRHRTRRVWNALIEVYNKLIAGIPAVVVLMILYYIAFGAVDMPAVIVAIIGFALIFGARAYGVIWTDELDIETETIYEDGDTVREVQSAGSQTAASAVAAARALSGMSQKQLAAATGIDQSDISKIERGVANPSVSTLERIAKALGGQLSISIAVPIAK